MNEIDERNDLKLNSEDCNNLRESCLVTVVVRIDTLKQGIESLYRMNENHLRDMKECIKDQTQRIDNILDKLSK